MGHFLALLFAVGAFGLYVNPEVIAGPIERSYFYVVGPTVAASLTLRSLGVGSWPYTLHFRARSRPI
jgi:hypothetical protein